MGLRERIKQLIAKTQILHENPVWEKSQGGEGEYTMF